jgi:hypothetical protein
LLVVDFDVGCIPFFNVVSTFAGGVKGVLVVFGRGRRVVFVVDAVVDDLFDERNS